MNHVRTVKDRYLLIGPAHAYVDMFEYLTRKSHCALICAYGDLAVHMANAFQPDKVVISLDDGQEAEATVRALQALPLGATHTVIGMGEGTDGLACGLDVVAPCDVTYFGLMRRLRRFEENLTVRVPQGAPDSRSIDAGCLGGLNSRLAGNLAGAK